MTEEQKTLFCFTPDWLLQEIYLNPETHCDFKLQVRSNDSGSVFDVQ